MRKRAAIKQGEQRTRRKPPSVTRIYSLPYCDPRKWEYCNNVPRQRH